MQTFRRLSNKKIDRAGKLRERHVRTRQILIFVFIEGEKSHIKVIFHDAKISSPSLSTSRLQVVGFTALSGVSPIREFPWDLPEFPDYARLLD